jgi:hypothetical protein
MIDWAALGQVVAYSFVAAVAVAVLFSAGVVLSTTDEDGGRAPAPRIAVAGLAFLASLALVVLGLYVMFTTK